MLSSQHGADEADQWSCGRENAHDVGTPPNFSVEPLLYPALVAGSTRRDRDVSSVEALEVVGEGVNDAFVAGGFVGPAAGLGVGS